MFCKIDNYLRILYRYSGYIAAFFLILVATFILIGITSRIFNFYIRGLAEYSGYCMAASSFLALAYTFSENGHIRITLFLEKTKKRHQKSIRVMVLICCFSFFWFFILLLCENAVCFNRIWRKKRRSRRNIYMDTSIISSNRFNYIFYLHCS